MGYCLVIQSHQHTEILEICCWQSWDYQRYVLRIRMGVEECWHKHTCFRIILLLTSLFSNYNSSLHVLNFIQHIIAPSLFFSPFLSSQWVMNASKSYPFVRHADQFICSVLHESPTKWAHTLVVVFSVTQTCLRNKIIASWFEKIYAFCQKKKRKKSIHISGGLMFKPGSCNSQHFTALPFILLVYS